MDAGLKRELEAKVYAGERLTREDGVALYSSDDLTWLGRLAHHRRTERAGAAGGQVMFSVSLHLDLAGVDLAEESVREQLASEKIASEQRTELHLGDVPLPDDYLKVLRDLAAALPNVQLKGFTATDILRVERSTGRPAGKIIDELFGAGLASLSGSAAEVPGGDDWSRVHRLAHERGVKTPATMVYGHVEEPVHQVDHLLGLRELQDATGGFATFVPLPAGEGAAMPAESLKTFAVSRLLFDNVPHLTCSLVAHGQSVAQLSLNFGADDLDGPVTGSETPRDDLLHLIWDAGFQPVERDARYGRIREFDAPVPLAERRSEPQRVWA